MKLRDKLDDYRDKDSPTGYSQTNPPPQDLLEDWDATNREIERYNQKLGRERPQKNLRVQCYNSPYS
jgi:hypothetical protein